MKLLYTPENTSACKNRKYRLYIKSLYNLLKQWNTFIMHAQESVYFEFKGEIRDAFERRVHKPEPTDKSISDSHNRKTDRDLALLSFWTLSVVRYSKEHDVSETRCVSILR
jgi:hypothetical protein